MPTILILVHSRKNRRLLAETLQEDTHTLCPDPHEEEGRRELTRGDWDLCIVDGVVLDRYWDEAIARKQEAEEVFLPLLLVTAREGVQRTTRHLWRAIDEIIASPIQKLELRARVETLLRARRYSRRLSRRYDTLAATAPVGIVRVDHAGEVTYANPFARQMLGSVDESWTDESSMECLLEDESGTSTSVGELVRRRVLATSQDVFDMRCFVGRRGSGDHRVVSINAASLMDEGGAREGALCTLQDVTERERFVEHLEIAREEAEAANRLKGRMLDNMSHEFRTPLTGIIGFTSILEEELEGRHVEFLQHIQASSERLLTTLDSVLTLSQLESGSKTLSSSELDVGQEIEDICRPHAARADKRGLDMHIEGTGSGMVAVFDRSALRRIVDHLLANAIRFTSEGHVTVRLEADEEELTIFVEDTGIGIGKDFLPRIYDPFTQESSGLTRDYEGSGIGLAVVRKLVHATGGTIIVESEQGAGTTVVVTLPREPPRAAERQDALSSS